MTVPQRSESKIIFFPAFLKGKIMRYFCLFLMVLWFAGCSNSDRNNRHQEEQKNKQEKQVESLERGGRSCYFYATDRDTVYLLLHPVVGDKIKGSLSYNFFERGGNIGYIQGEMRGDTLLANYTLLSEGQVSDREVVFYYKMIKSWKDMGRWRWWRDVRSFGIRTLWILTMG